MSGIVCIDSGLMDSLDSTVSMVRFRPKRASQVLQHISIYCKINLYSKW